MAVMREVKQMGAIHGNVPEGIVDLRKKTIAALTKQVELLDKDGVSQGQVDLAVCKIQTLKDLYQAIR